MNKPLGCAYAVLAFLGAHPAVALDQMRFAHGASLCATGSDGSVCLAGNGPIDTTRGAYLSQGYAWLARLNARGETLYATYLPVSAAALAVDASGAALIVANQYNSLAGPVPTTPGAFRSQPLGHQDMVVVKVNPAGTAAVFVTYFGGTDWDEWATGIAGGPDGSVYLTGSTDAPDFPVSSDALQAQPRRGGFFSQLSADGSKLLYSTTMYGAQVAGVAADPLGNAYLVGGCQRGTFGYSGSFFSRQE